MTFYRTILVFFLSLAYGSLQTHALSQQSGEAKSYVHWEVLPHPTDVELLKPMAAELLPPCEVGCRAILGAPNKCKECQVPTTCQISRRQRKNPHICNPGCLFMYHGFYIRLWRRTGKGGCQPGCRVVKCLST